MKIGEMSDKHVEGLSQWVEDLKDLSEEELVKSLAQLSEWNWEKIEDLSPIASVLDRIDGLLQKGLQSKDYELLVFALSKTYILIEHTAYKDLYNSVEELTQCLDLSNWQVVFEALKVINLLVIRVSPSNRNSKAHRNPELAEKLYCLGMQNKLSKFVETNTQSLQTEVECELLALSAVVQMWGEKQEEVKASLPEVWLLPNLSKVLRAPEPSMQTVALVLIGGILRLPEAGQLVGATNLMLAPWQQHGLFQSLLRELGSPKPSPFISALLDLATIYADYNFRMDSSHVAGMTASLLQMLSQPHTAFSIARGLRILSLLVSHSIDMFKELDGLSTVISLTIKELDAYNSDPRTVYLLKSALRLIRISLNKWEQTPNIPSEQVRTLFDSGLLRSIKASFAKKKFEIFEPALHLLITLINDQPGLIPELINEGVVIEAVNAIEGEVPGDAKLVGVILKFLVGVSLHREGVDVLENSSCVGCALQALGTVQDSIISNELAISIGENLQELMGQVPGIREKAVQGCITLINKLQSETPSSKQVFFTQLNNIGRLLSMIFNFSNELIRGFLDSGGIDSFLALFKLPILPLTYSNEYHSVLSCFKSVPVNLTPLVLTKVLEALNQQLAILEDITGQAQDFSQVPQDLHERLLHILTSTDSFVEMTRLVLQYGTGISQNVEELCATLAHLPGYMKLLIADQARLSSFSKPSTKTAQNFNIPIDIQDIENAELKTFEENFYFTCQLSVRRLFRFATRMAGGRGRQGLKEEEGVKVSRTMGEVLTELIKVVKLENFDQAKAYHFCLQLSDILKILLHEQGCSLATIYCFSQAGGLQHLLEFITQLKDLSFEYCSRKDLPYDFVNSLQILWSLAGKCLEGLASGKYASGAASSLREVLRRLGAPSSKEIVKGIQNQVLELISQINYLECGIVSTTFAKSVMEVLKQLAVKEQVDPSSLQQVMEMGFPEHVARHAILNVGPSVEMATEWILSRPELLESMPNEEPQSASVGSLHSILLSQIRAVPSLQSVLAELLLKISDKSEAPHTEIADMLLREVISLGNCLFEGAEDFSELKHTTPSFEHLRTALALLSTLSSKSADIFSALDVDTLTSICINFLKALIDNPSVCGNNLEWVASLFSMMNCLVKYAEVGTEEMINLLSQLIKQNQETCILADQDHSLLQLLISLTKKPEQAKLFLEKEALKPLLLMKTNKPELRLKGMISSFFALLKQLCEDPYIIQANFETDLLSKLTSPQPMNSFVQGFKKQLKRSNFIFETSLKSVCRVVQREEGVFVEPKAQKDTNEGEHWEVVPVIAHALASAFECEQTAQVTLMLQTEHLLSLLADLLQIYPVLVPQLLQTSVATYDLASQSIQTNKFLSHFFKNFAPFRYTLKIQQDKILFTVPQTQETVSAETYQSWMKVIIKFLKPICFKQTHKDPESHAGKRYTQSILGNNTCAVNTRKRIIRCIKELLSEQLKKDWFWDEKSMSIVRCLCITLMQLLREPPKGTFTSGNSGEIAKICEQQSYSKLLSELAKGVDLSFKKAPSMLNLILAPLQLLIHYNITSALHQKNASASSINLQESFDSEEQQEMEQLDEEDEEMLEDQESEVMEEENEMGEIMIEPRSTEALWAEDLELEEIDRERQIVQHPARNESLERNLIHQAEEPAFIFRAREFGRGFLENIEDPSIMQLIRDMDPYVGEEFLQRRRREAPARNPPVVPEFSNFEDLVANLSASAVLPIVEEPEQPLEPQEPLEPVEPVEPMEVEEPQPHQENPQEEEKMQVEEERKEVPEGIDPSVLEELPEEIRNEILAQYQPPQASGQIAEDFLEALPPDIRAELESSQRRATGEDIDNATFIASLTPELRREILMTASDELLASLPPELVAEARELQDIAMQQRHQVLMERAQPHQRHLPTPIAEVVIDDKLAESLIQLDEAFLNFLFSVMHLSLNRDILASLFLDLSVQPFNRQRILEGLVGILQEDLPIQSYALTSGRVLDTLQHLCSFNPKVAPDIASLNLNNLIGLIDHHLYRISTSHLTPLISLLAEIIEKAPQVPDLEPQTIIQICSLLNFQSLNEDTVKTVVTLLAKLAENDQNKLVEQKALTEEVRTLEVDIAESLRSMQASLTGEKEVQLLRVCKVIKSISNEPMELDSLWVPLTEALNSITQTETDLASTTSPTLSKLLPVIETFFICHTDCPSKDSFQAFCDRNRKVLNLLVKQNPSLLKDTFNSLVTKFPSLLDFENKRKYFRTEIRSLRPQRGYDSIRLNVRRHEVFMDSFHQLKVRSAEEMHGKLRVSFLGEEGVDAGGLTREWYGLLSREMFNPNYALFVPSANGVSFQPNSKSYINPDHLSFFKFVGRIIGKALCDNVALDVYFTRSFYKHILGQEVSHHDMEDLDPDFYRNLQMLTEINLNESDLHEYYFAYEEEEFGQMIVKELAPGGKDIRVTEENKMEYVKNICHMKMTRDIQAQIDSFLEGLYEIVPKELLGVFDSKELELLIAGLPDFDIEDLKNNTDLHNYSRDSSVILWLWEILSEFTHEERAEFLQFVTGSAKIPLEGFKALQGMGGVQKFQIHKSFAGVDRLPSAHTCMNQLDLPEYPSKEVLYQRLKLALSEGKEGFGFM